MFEPTLKSQTSVATCNCLASAGSCRKTPGLAAPNVVAFEVSGGHNLQGFTNATGCSATRFNNNQVSFKQSIPSSHPIHKRAFLYNLWDLLFQLRDALCRSLALPTAVPDFWIVDPCRCMTLIVQEKRI